LEKNWEIPLQQMMIEGKILKQINKSTKQEKEKKRKEKEKKKKKKRKEKQKETEMVANLDFFGLCHLFSKGLEDWRKRGLGERM
jgi:Na+/glutamate symporter